jgi:hypothetical protein
MTGTARAIIDYAAEDNGTEMRDALYSAIQDKVLSHIEAKKQEIAQGLIAQSETQEQELQGENS